MAIYGLNLDHFLSSLIVDPEVMRQKAVTVEGKIRGMRSAFDELGNIVDKTKNYWIGEAGDAHRTYFTDKKPEIEEIFQRLSEHVRELNQMASVYSLTEQEVKELSEDLPSDVIV